MFFRCPAFAICAGGGRQGQSIKPGKKKKKKLSQFMEVHILEMPGAIYLKFRMWGTDVGGHLHSKNCPVLYK